MTEQVVTGLHIVGQIRTHEHERGSLSIDEFKKFLSDVLVKYSLHELGSHYYLFEEGGFTGVVSLMESHVAVHTWPELDYVTLDVYLCNYSRSNEETCREVFAEICEYFNPVSVDKKEIIR